LTLTDALDRVGELERVGGAGFVSALADGMPKVSNVAQYAKIVRERAVLRKVIHHTQTLQILALEGGSAPEILLDSAVQTLMEMALECSTAKTETKSYREASAAFLKTFDERSSIRFVTGIDRLDYMTGGFQAGELITICAGTGVGKTLLASQARKVSCDRGMHSLYCSGEMTGEHLVSRELATEAPVKHWKMRQPEQVIQAEMAALVEAAARQCSDCKILDGELSLQKIRMAARRQKRTGKLHCVIVDYDELVDAPGRVELDQQRNLVRGLKSLAMELQIPVIIISQLRKSLNKEDAAKPTLERLYGSGAKSKHTSIVLYVDREYVRELTGDETQGTVYVLKSRDGRLKQVPVLFNLATLRFDNAPEFGDMPATESRGSRRKARKEEGEE
jgi:replicative DNA helicase